MVKLYFLGLVAALGCIFSVQSVSAEINNQSPPFSLTIEQALLWSEDAATVDVNNISQVALASRWQGGNSLNDGTDSEAKVLLAPDGMNNFANYLQPQNRFNLYNFTHWSYIDTLNWFAGTATQTVNIPARPWVETAHKNGVKVIGTVFLGIAQWGGSADTVEAFLKRDENGDFIMAKQLVRIANFYRFDGWLINQETDLTVVKDAQGEIIAGEKDNARAKHLASEMLAFTKQLTALSGSELEIHWYDSMLMDGSVAWQNALTEKNQPFLQTSVNEAKTSDAMFMNYWWNGAMVEQSRQRALELGRSPFDLYFGVDLWPQRNAQKAFTENRWIDAIFPQKGKAGLTSIALFANNFNFNFSGDKRTPAYSTFETEPSDVRRFYDTETRLFAGDDLNIAKTEQKGWRGLGAYITARSVINQLPFQTYFNTGHGTKLFEYGEVKHQQPWHDISQQDILPTWQFAVLGNTKTDIFFDFEQPFHGGSALTFQAQPSENSSIIPLFKTALKLQKSSKVKVFYRGNNQRDEKTNPQFVVKFSDGSQVALPLIVDQSHWQQSQLDLSRFAGKTVVRIEVELAKNNVATTLTLGGFRIE